MRKLDEAAVRERLASYDDEGITDELYDFGKMLVAELIDRNGRLETKAASIAAYSIGIITLLASTYASWSKVVHTLAMPIPLFGAIAAFVAAVYAIRGLVLQRYEGISQNEWINAECLTSREKLRRYHIIAMWGVLNSHEAVSEKKASQIAKAQLWLFIAAIVLVLSLLDAAIVLRLTVRLGIAFW